MSAAEFKRVLVDRFNPEGGSLLVVLIISGYAETLWPLLGWLIGAIGSNVAWLTSEVYRRGRDQEAAS